jgi:predicted AlkP superfamily pyrophosphatase or phosphodiesterase
MAERNNLPNDLFKSLVLYLPTILLITMRSYKNLYFASIVGLFVFGLPSCADHFNKKKEIITSCKSGTEPIRKVLFIGIDGLRTDALQAANTPALDSLVQHAYTCWNLDRGPYTVSVPGWSTILHGVWPEKHGLTENSFKKNQYETYPDFFALAKKVKPNFSVATLSHWDDFLKITTQEDFAQRFSTDALVFDAAKTKFESCCPDIMLLHFDDTDAAGHAYGFSPNCSQYISAVEQTDLYIKGIMDIIHNRESTYGEEWMVVLTTDHGGEGTGHGGQDDLPQTRKVWSIVRVPTLTSPVQQVQANSVDLLPTMLNWMGIAPETISGLDGVKIF